MSSKRNTAIVLLASGLLTGAGQAAPQADWEMVARIREEGFQRSQLADTLSYMTDVLGARLTVSPGMRRAQRWAIGEMERIGLTNIEIEPFMDYGISWSNEYASLHMMEPDYQPMVGYPLSHTPGTDGRQELQVAIADTRARAELEARRQGSPVDPTRGHRPRAAQRRSAATHR